MVAGSIHPGAQVEEEVAVGTAAVAMVVVEMVVDRVAAEAAGSAVAG